MSRTLLALLAVVVIVVIALFATGFWSVKQTREGELPTVDVKAEGGQLPAFNPESKEVVVGTTEANVTVPTVETKNTTIDVPVVGVKDDGNNQ